LLLRPEFEVLRTVVVTDAVLVVNLFVSLKRSPENLLHDESVLENVRLSRPGPGALGRLWRPYPDVATRHLASAEPPPAVGTLVLLGVGFIRGTDTA